VDGFDIIVIVILLPFFTVAQLSICSFTFFGPVHH